MLFANFGEKFPPTNHITESTICSYNTGKSWLFQHNDRHFLDDGSYQFVIMYVAMHVFFFYGALGIG